MSLQSSEVDHGQCEQDTLDTNSARDAIVMIRDNENARFLTEVSQMENAITIISDAINFLDQLVAGEASLLELTQHTMSFIKIGHRTGHMSEIAPLITMFAQMAASE
jgi:uncharacterized protein with PhoU and TrkA domain